jgi:hypothetical protein
LFLLVKKFLALHATVCESRLIVTPPHIILRHRKPDTALSSHWSL